MARLALERVTKCFGALRALDDVTVTVGDAELLAVVGPSGSGKTTLLRAIAGLERIDAGRIAAGGRDVTQLAPAARNVALVFQDFALFPHLSVRGNIAFGLRGRSNGRVDDIAQRLGIGALLARRPDSLSGGEKQRVAVARALVRDPAALLFDEPFASLDAPLRAALRVELAEIRAAAPVPSIFVTHDQHEALALGDRVAVMQRGRVVALGVPRELLAAPPDPFTARFLGTPPANVFGGHVSGGRFTADAEPALACADVAERVRTIAVRPERVAVANDGAVRGRVRFVESIGTQRYATVATPSATIVALAPDGVATGDTVGLAFDFTDMWTYDDAGRRIG